MKVENSNIPQFTCSMLYLILKAYNWINKLNISSGVTISSLPNSAYILEPNVFSLVSSHLENEPFLYIWIGSIAWHVIIISPKF